MNISMHISFKLVLLFSLDNSSGIARSYSSPSFNFLRKLHTVFHSDCTNLHFYQLLMRVSFLLHHHQYCHLLFFFFFNNSHSDRHWYEVISLGGFDLHFPYVWWCWASFYVPGGHMCVFFGKMSIQTLYPFFNQSGFFFFYWIVWVLCTLHAYGHAKSL